MTARPSASNDPGASKTATNSALSTTIPHVAAGQPTQTQNPVQHPTQEVYEHQPKKSSSGTDSGQIASKGDSDDPRDTLSLYHNIHESPRQSDDPDKPSDLIDLAGSRASSPAPKYRHTPTSQQSQIVPQPAPSHKSTAQYDLQAADLSDLLRVLPSRSHSGKQDPSRDAPMSTRDPEKLKNHQGIFLPLSTTTPATVVAEHVTAPLPSELSAHSEITSPFTVPIPDLHANIPDDIRARPLWTTLILLFFSAKL